MRILLFIAAVFLTELSFAQAPQLVIPRGHNADIKSLAISPDKKWLASGDDKGAVKLWDMPTGKEVKTFDNNADPSILNGINDLAFSPDGKKLYIGRSATLLIADLSNGGREIFNKKILSITDFFISSMQCIFSISRYTCRCTT